MILCYAEIISLYWRLLSVTDLAGGAQVTPPFWAKISSFSYKFWNRNWSNSRLALPWGWHTLWKILDPPLLTLVEELILCVVPPGQGHQRSQYIKAISRH